MPDYRSVLKRVGIVLLAFGAVDITSFIIAVVRGHNASFGFLEFIAGFFLLRGSLKAARRTAYLCAIFIAMIAAMLVVFPFIMTPGLVWAYLTIEPASALWGATLMIITAGVLTWTYRSLTQSCVLQALEEAGEEPKRWRRPQVGFVFGAVLTGLIASLVAISLNGDAGKRAKEEAAKKTGEGYRFVVTSLSGTVNNSTGHHTAQVTAYNRDSIQQVSVEW